MNYINKHLRIPLGLFVDNTRDFIVQEGNFEDDDDKNISVAQDKTMDYFYDSVVISKKKRASIHKTQKKKQSNSRSSKKK